MVPLEATVSTLPPEHRHPELGAFTAELDRAHDWMYTRADVVPLEELRSWSGGSGADSIRHESGRFFSVTGVEVELPGEGRSWSQPIIDQPEIGILGILAKEFDGVLHFLMQAKVEPGNPNGLQLSPTVQATRSNYTRVHAVPAVPYLDYFRRHRDRPSVVSDVRQSEQGALVPTASATAT